MAFPLYSFIGPITAKQMIIDKIQPFRRPPTYFIREITATELICDEYDDENIVTFHVKIPLSDSTNYEIKPVRATYKIREFYPDTKVFVDNPQIFTRISDITSKAPIYIPWDVSVVCEADCKAFGIDLNAPWPPML